VRVVGIDPGLKGGLALIVSEAGQAFAEQMPIAGRSIDVAELALFLRGWGPDVVYIEKVGPMPKQGVVSTFTFGEGYGLVKGAIIALGYRLELVAPQTWKAQVLAGTKKDKEAAVDYCRRAYPSVRLVPEQCRVAHDGMADALCLAEYGRLREKGVR